MNNIKRSTERNKSSDKVDVSIKIRKCCSTIGSASYCSSCGRPASHTPKLYKSEKMFNKTLFIKGQFRKPKKGEFYLSGAIAEVYEAFNDLSDEFYIAVPVDLID